VENRTRVDLPAYVTEPFEVFVNGVPQADGTDFNVLGSSLVFERSLVHEGNLGFWRWARMFFGVAGTYRKSDTIDVSFTIDGRPRVVTLAPAEPGPPAASHHDR
jgi:hypothetical protein